MRGCCDEEAAPKERHGAERSALTRNIHGGWVRNQAKQAKMGERYRASAFWTGG
jgi:hypothetical protein